MLSMDELELRYDGPIPEEMKIIARYGSTVAYEQSRARAQRRFFANMASSQIRSIRKRRQTFNEGGYDHVPLVEMERSFAGQLADLAFYFREFRKWNAYAWRLARRDTTAAIVPDAAE